MKYNSTGSRIWTKLTGTPDDEYSLGLAVDPSGFVYLCGSILGSIDGALYNGDIDILLMKYNSTTGNKVWTTLAGSAGNDYGLAVTVDTSKNVIVSGFVNAALDNETYAGGLFDMVVIKYNSSGNKIYSRLLGNTSTDWAYALSSDSSGNVFVTGSVSGNLENEMKAGRTDIVLVKYSP
jgi:hypothetical protein